jgi:rubredoxin-NAD+ reductase
VLSVNTLDDYAVLRDRLSAAGASARVAIIGAGLIGCEFADDLRTGGHQVTLIDPNPAPLAALAPPAISAGLQALQARQVQFRLGTTSSSIDRTDTGLRITLANGEYLDVDVILSAVGLRADIRLAQEAHLQTERGILVDQFGQTSVKGIYALGDCAQYAQADGNSITLPYVAPIMAAARAIAQSLAGTPTAIDFKPAPVLVKTPSYPIALVAPPLAQAKAGNGKANRAMPARYHHICRFIDNDGSCAASRWPQEAKIGMLY